MARDPGRPSRGPTRRGQACVLLYAGAFVAVTLIGFLPLPPRVRRGLQRPLLRPAAWAGRRVDWAAHDWVARVRRALGTAPTVRALTRRLLDDALAPTDESAGYVGTVVPPDGARDGGSGGDTDTDTDIDAGAWLEHRLAAAGFRRNPTAYLEYRVRDRERDRNDDGGGRQLERSSWAYRDSVTASHQLHVRLFDGGDGTVDVYGHHEPSVLAGAAHYGPPDYRTGVAMARRAFERAGIPIEGRADPGGAAESAPVADVAATPG